MEQLTGAPQPIVDRMTKLRFLALGLAVLGFLLIAAAGPGSRLELWTFRTGFTLLRWGAYLGIAGAGLAVVVFAVERPRGAAVAGLALALAIGIIAALVPWRWRDVASSVPPIHDISTDLDRPPEFVAVLPLRAEAPNSARHGGAEVAAAQREAYPDIQPVQLAAPPATAFAQALEAALSMGWEIVAADSATGRIEATATTRWFGFKDDVVIRVEPAEGGSRVDVRSVSRVGRGDVGTNARRIREYVEALGGGGSASP